MKKILLTLLTVICAVSSWGYTYTKVTSAPQDWSGTYVLVGNGNGNGKTYAFNGTDAVNGCTEITITDGVISDYTGVTLVVASLPEGGYSVKIDGGTNDGKYISSGSAAPTYANALKFNDTAHPVFFEFAAGNVTMKQTIEGSGNVTMRFNYAVDQMRFRFYKSGQQPVQLYKQDAAVINVHATGVTLNKTTANIIAGKQTTLIATVAPANADNKNVTWTTSDAGVATVNDGVVTAVAPGSATITATTQDGNYTANCVVTVSEDIAFAGILYSWDGSQKSSSSSANETGGNATVVGSTSNVVGGSSKLNWCLQLGKGYSSGANYIKITLDKPLKAGDIITTGCFVTGSTKPTADLVYGINFEGSNEITLTYDADDESASQIPYISTNTAPADQSAIIVPAAAEGKNEIWIYRKSGSTTLYVSKFIVTRPETINITTTEGYSTFVSNYAIVMPENIEGSTATVSGGELTLGWEYTAGTTVPANTPILVKGTKGAHKANITTGGTPASTNYLVANTTGSVEEAWYLADDLNENSKYYVLSYDSNDDNLGFYWFTATGNGEFDVPVGKVFLHVPAGVTSARGFVLNGKTTGIKAVESVKESNVVYNLAGQRVAANTKGIVIVNGKKMLNK